MDAVKTILMALLVSSVATADEPRESGLDRKVFIEEGIVEVPELPPLCDSLKLDHQRISIGDCTLYCETAGRGPARCWYMPRPMYLPQQWPCSVAKRLPHPSLRG